ncbi:MAG TPA: PDC sensor domain-containing protein [Sulfurovum sp.]|uniref:PDC sensor domain-containing protein n=1 Tax=Sulfurovum sp. TaxID=1969726 RepID=UPI002F954984
MKVVINLYKRHMATVDNYITTAIKNAPKEYIEHADQILKKYTFFQLLYSVDEEYRQISPVVFRKHREDLNVGSDKSHYFTKLELDEDGFYISNPYIHYRTGRASITVVRKIEGIYYVFDCDLISVLEELRLIQFNSVHHRFKQAVYMFGSGLLVAISLALLFYSGYKFVMTFWDGDANFLHDVFKAIIAATLGIAIFDLAKQIIEHEVIFHTFTHDDTREYKVLGKFLVSIIIALLIETLMVVFKIALDDYKDMQAAFFLLIGTTAMFVGLAYFYKTIIGRCSTKAEE